MMQDQARQVGAPGRLAAAVFGCLAACLLLTAGCHRQGSAAAGGTPDAGPWESASSPDTIDSIARDYVRVALALGERDPDSLDYSIAPAAIQAKIREAYPADDQIDREAASLEDRLARIGAGDAESKARVEFLRLQLRAIRARARMLHGAYLDFDSEAAALFATTRLPDGVEDMVQQIGIRASILRQLPVSAHGTTLAARYGAYDRRFLVPPDTLKAVMSAALNVCRARTLEHMQLPAGESVDLTFVHRQPWSAFSRYRGNAHSTISLNLDFPITVDDALELACHEGYPGHHVFNTLRDQALLTQNHWPEAALQLTFSPQSYLSEAAAAYAPRLAFSVAERTRIERETLFPLAGLNPAEAERYVAISSAIRQLSPAEPAIAREYLDGRLEFVRAGRQLGDELLMANADASLLYMNEYRTYMLAYTDGPRRIAAVLPPESGPAAARWKAYAALMVNPQTRLP